LDSFGIHLEGYFYFLRVLLLSLWFPWSFGLVSRVKSLQSNRKVLDSQTPGSSEASVLRRQKEEQTSESPMQAPNLGYKTEEGVGAGILRNTGTMQIFYLQ
jgi:hypothetical protein